MRKQTEADFCNLHEFTDELKLIPLWADKLFTSTLTGAAGILAILLVLLVFLFYKYKQVCFSF